MSRRVTRSSGIPLIHQEVEELSEKRLKKPKQNGKQTQKQKANTKEDEVEEEDDDQQTQSLSEEVKHDYQSKQSGKGKDSQQTQTQEKAGGKGRETKEERQERLKMEKEEKLKKEEEERKKKEEEDRKYIEEFKERNNLTKGKNQKERIENYQNKHYSVKKKDKKPSKDDEIDLLESSKSTVHGKIGLQNLGNTCFMNSALQCLSNLQPLTDYCLQNKEDNELNVSNPLGSGGIVIKAFSNLIRDIWSNKNDSISPEEFLRVISFCNSIYSSGRQQDSQEFLLYLLDQIHEDLNRVDKKPYVEQKEYFKDLNQKEMEKLAFDSWGDYLKRNKSVIVDLFQGQMKNTLKCLTCKTTKYQFEPFMYLTVPISPDAKNDITIQDCIRAFIEKEELDGDEKWYCPECKEFRKSEKKIDLWKLPPILMICMKRFQYTAKSKKKITTKVDFPIHHFDLSEFIPKTLQKEKPIYDLFSVISHSGYLNFGHYVAYCKNQEDKQWYLFNDSKTSQISEPDKDLIKRQTLVESINWPHKV